MSDEDEALVLSPDEGEEEIAHGVGVGVVEVAGGLVGEDQVGVVAEGAGDRDPLPLSAGEEFGGKAGPLRQADLGEEIESAAPVEGLSGDSEGHEDVLERGEVFEEIVGLENKADVEAPERRAVCRRRELACDGDGAEVGSFERAEDVEEGRFSLARSSCDGGRLPPLKRERDFFEEDDLLRKGKGFGDLARVEDHSDLRTLEGLIRPALRAGMRPAARERRGVAMRTKRRASPLS